MARAYTVATVGLALGVPAKWIDNVLSRFAVSGVTQRRQGIARRISADGVLELAVIQKLGETLRVPVEIAVSHAQALATTGQLHLAPGLRVELDKRNQLEEIERRLAYAVEAAPVPRRGRPPLKAKRGAD